MNIYSNVEKENTSKKFMTIIVMLLLLGAAYAYWNASVVSVSPPMQSNGMSEVDRIKDLIRQKKFLKQQAVEAGKEAADKGDFDKSRELADKVGTLGEEIDKLYDDLHEASVKEGVNGETK